MSIFSHLQKGSTMTCAVSQRWRFFLSLAAIVLGVICLPHSGHAQLIKFATLAPEGTAWMNLMEEFTTHVESRTNGKVTFRIFANMVAGDEAVVLRKIRVGQLHGGGFTGNGLGQILPEVRVLELPYLFQSEQEIDAVYTEMFDYFSDAFEQKGYILLGWAEVGWVHFFTNKALRSTADISGVKMWVWEGDPLAEATFKAFDVPAIPLPITEVYTSLQTGLIDGVYASPMAAMATQWFTRVKFMSSTPMTNAIGAVLVSKRMFSRLSAPHQTILREEGKRLMQQLITQSRKDNVESITLMSKVKLQVVDLTESGVQEFQQGGMAVYGELAGQLFPQALLDRITAIIHRVRTNGEAE